MLAFVGRNVSTPDSPGSFAWAVKTGRTFLANVEPSDAREVHPTRTFARSSQASASAPPASCR